MTYTPQSHIQTVKDVKAFFRYLVDERKITLQPDNLFEKYVNDGDGAPVFNEDECALFDRLMDEAFDVCGKYNADIYEIGINIVFP